MAELTRARGKKAAPEQPVQAPHGFKKFKSKWKVMDQASPREGLEMRVRDRASGMFPVEAETLLW
jgi:hypothetical protein